MAGQKIGYFLWGNGFVLWCNVLVDITQIELKEVLGLIKGKSNLVLDLQLLIRVVDAYEMLMF